jgi:hypothetical protein
MAVKPQDWESWWLARGRMPEIWGGWSETWMQDHATATMVVALRSGKVQIRGEARALDYPWGSLLIEDVVSKLRRLRLGLDRVTVEYGVGPVDNSLPFPSLGLKSAVIIGAELVWPEFRAELIRTGLPACAEPNPDPTELLTSDPRFKQRRRKAAYKGALAVWMAPQNLGLLRRMGSEKIASGFRSYCETKRTELLPLLPKRLRSMHGPIERIMKERQAKVDARSD